MRNTKKTIHEWEKELNIKLLDLDGFDERDEKLFTRLFSRKEFEKSAAECTIMKVRDEPGQPLPRTRKKRHYKRYLLLLVLFSMPVVATVIVNFLFRAVARVVHIKWYIPATILLVDAAILLIQPDAAVLSGPFFLWYHVLNMLHHQWQPFWTHVRYSVFHQPLNLIDTDKPLFYDVEIHGAPLYLYFGLSQALTSSLFWATSIGSLKCLLTNRGHTHQLRH